MASLGNPKKHTTNLKRKNGGSTVQELEFRKFKMNGKPVKVLKKDDIDDLVRAEVKKILQDEGPSYISVSYVTDMPYSTGFRLFEKASDADNLGLSNESFSDYEEKGIMSGDTNVRAVMIFKLVAHNTNRGKYSDNGKNDCLYECLIQGFRGCKLPKVLRSPGKFKKWLGLKRKEGVHVGLIPKVEDKLKCNIDVCGQYEYKSEKKYARDLKIRLWKDHYERLYTMNEFADLMKGYKEWRGKRRYPIFYKINREEQTVKFAYYSDHRSKGKIKVKTKPVKWIDDFYVKNPKRFHYFRREVEEDRKTKTIPEPEDYLPVKLKEYQDFQCMAHKLLGETAKGSLDPLKCSGNVRALATQFLLKCCPKFIGHTDQFDYNDDPMLSEEMWIKKGSSGGLMFAKKQTHLKRGYHGDINSNYGYLLKKCQFITRRGEFKTIEKVPRKYDDTRRYSIYRCRIWGVDRRDIYPNSRNFFTGFDVETAVKRGYRVSMIQDEYPNVLEYADRCRIKGKVVFGKWVDALYTMKKAGVTMAKLVMNILWGYLASGCTYDLATHKEYAPFEDNCQVKDIKPTFTKNGKRHYRLKMYHVNDMLNGCVRRKEYRFTWARFTPFLTAMGRKMIAEAVEPIRDHIVHIHTDGFISKKPFDHLKIGEKLGQWKVKEGEVLVRHVCGVDWI